MNQSLERWREKLNGSGLPVFARTVREISSVATNRISSAQDLSEVVSRDAGMTSRLLQIANSSLFNFQGRKVETVSAAVVMLGFDAVRELAVTLSVIDELLKGNQHARVSSCMTQGFLAAAHAKTFSSIVAPKNAEEAFVAGLLRDVGKMAFWSRAEAEAGELEAALAQESEAKAERNVLGFELRQLGEVLVEDWSLGDLVKRVIKGTNHDDPLVMCVESGHELARDILAHGWESEAVQNRVASIATLIDVDEDTLVAQVEASTADIKELIEHFGVPPGTADVPVLTQPVEAPDAAAAKHEAPNPADQAAAQQACLEAISDGLEEGLGRDALMEQLVQGVFETTCARVCYFMLLTPDRECLAVKYASGEGADDLPGRTQSVEQSLAGRALADRKVVEAQTDLDLPLYGGSPCLMKAVRVGGKPVGVLYMEGRTAPEAMASFKQFGQYVPLILTNAA